MKHLLQVFVSWFTFFVGINWASLSWLAGNLGSFGSAQNNQANSGNPPPRVINADFIDIVAYVFAGQNFLGILTGMVLLTYFAKVGHQDGLLFPRLMYVFAMMAMVLGLIPIGSLWLLIPEAAGAAAAQ